MKSRRTARTVAFIVFVIWATVQGSLSLWSFSQDAARRDFGHFVSSATAWRESRALYDNGPRVNLNPPHASIVLFAPLTWIPFDVATVFWAMWQVAALAITILFIARELHLPAVRLEWIVPAAVASAMTTHNWIEGQVGGILLIAGVVAWKAMRRNRANLSSIVFAGLINLKPQLMLMLLANDWRSQLRIILIGGSLALAGLLLCGPSLWASWIASTRAQGLQLSPWNVSIAPALHRSGAASWIPHLYALIAVAIVAITWRATRQDADRDRRWLLWGVATLLIAPVTWVYYAAAFLGPLIAWGERNHWPPAAKAGILLWLVPLQAVSWVASSPPGWTLGIIGSPYTLGAILLWFSVLATVYQPQHQLLTKPHPTS